MEPVNADGSRWWHCTDEDAQWMAGETCGARIPREVDHAGDEDEYNLLNQQYRDLKEARDEEA